MRSDCPPLLPTLQVYSFCGKLASHFFSHLSLFHGLKDQYDVSARSRLLTYDQQESQWHNGLTNHSKEGERIMTRARKTTRTLTVDAPIGDIFAFISDPTNRLRLWPSLIKIEDVQRLSNGGFEYRWTFNIFDLVLQGTSRDVEYRPTTRIRVEIRGGITGKVNYTFQSLDQKTRVTVAASYAVPPALLEKLAQAALARHNRTEVESVLTNLQALIG